MLDGLMLRAGTHVAGTPRLLSGVAHNDLKLLFETFAYLRATRERPRRTYSQDLDRPQAIGYSGEFVASVLHKQGDQPVSYALLPKIPRTITEARSQRDARAIQVQSSLLESVRTWLEELKLAKSVDSDFSKRQSDRLEIVVNLPSQQPH